MIRRIVASILVVALLGYGVAWAFDGHALDLAVEAATGVHQHPETTLDDGSCDHCCHAAAHIIGLVPPVLTFHLPGADSFRVGPGSAVAILISAPPLKPPRA